MEASLATLAVVIATFLVAWALTGWVRRVALARGLLDHPNARSSHTQPTPRGGGVAIVVAATASIAVLAALGAVDIRLASALIVGGLAVAVIGFLDDRRPRPASLRMLVHAAAAVAAVWLLGGLPPLQFGERVVDAGFAGDVAAVLALIWVLNLFNFMDGIDAIAASEAVFVTAAAAALSVAVGTSLVSIPAGLAVGAAALGFLAWNWPPARIFMGDAGSGYLGYVLGVLALGAARESAVALVIWLLLGGVFFVDATCTLIRRLLRGEALHVAHRTHAYQWLSRRWGSHLRTTLAVLGINVLWLLPCAWFAASNPSRAGWTALLGLVPLVALVLLAGAGRRETPAILPK